MKAFAKKLRKSKEPKYDKLAINEAEDQTIEDLLNETEPKKHECIPILVWTAILLTLLTALEFGLHLDQYLILRKPPKPKPNIGDFAISSKKVILTAKSENDGGQTLSIIDDTLGASKVPEQRMPSPVVDSPRFSSPVTSKATVSSDDFILEVITNGVSERSTLNLPISHLVSYQNYPSNADVRWCLKMTPSSLVLAEIDFLEMDTERGFDFVMIHNHYNPPEAYSGNSQIPKLTEIVGPAEYKELCVHFQSDENIEKAGIRFNFDVRQTPGKVVLSDECTVKTDPCYHPLPEKSHCGRGPWRDGKCGIGVRSKKLECESEIDDNDSICKSIDFQNEWCELDKCENHPVPEKVVCDTCKIRYAYRPHTVFWDGVGRLDPVKPDLFSYFPSTQSSFDVDAILKRLDAKKREMLSEHVDSRFLEFDLLDNEAIRSSLRILGFRLVRSLLLGKRFVSTFTGSSNTAGHDNMFASTYPMQLQTLLRTLWEEVGYKGAAFQVKNAATGGHFGTNLVSWCVPALIGDDPDIVFWESFMNDGSKPVPKFLELHYRNAITRKKKPLWAAIQTNAKPANYMVHEYRHETLGNYKDFSPLAGRYSKYAGFLMFWLMQGRRGFGDQKPYDEMNVNWHPNPIGHRFMAQGLAYHYIVAAEIILKEFGDRIKSLSPDGVPTEDLDKLLIDEDPSQAEELPESVWCSENCKLPSWCTTMLKPADSKYRIDLNQIISSEGWKIRFWDDKLREKQSDFASIMNRDGGQSPMDDMGSMRQYFPDAEEGTLEIAVKSPSGRIIVVSGTGEKQLSTGMKVFVDDKLMKCSTEVGHADEKPDMRQKLQGITRPLVGCTIDGVQPGKHVVKITYKKDEIEEYGLHGVSMIIGF